MFQRLRPAKPLLKLLRSAVANAKNSKRLDPEKLVIKNIRVDQGPMLKRILPRARGIATPIQKKMSHVTLILEEKTGVAAPRFKIVVPKKSKMPKPTKAKAKDKSKEAQPEKAAPKKSGFFRRVFSRKAV